MGIVAPWDTDPKANIRAECCEGQLRNHSNQPNWTVKRRLEVKVKVEKRRKMKRDCGGKEPIHNVMNNRSRLMSLASLNLTLNTTNKVNETGMGIG